MVPVGGAEESLNAKPGCYNLVLNKRKGFVKLAMKHGYGECTHATVKRDMVCILCTLMELQSHSRTFCTLTELQCGR